MRIAVDAAALGERHGIGRYLGAVLEHAWAEARPDDAWLLYGRRAQSLPAGTMQRSDHLPAAAGRVLSLFSTLPWFVARDRPDVFWGPAHRLPLRLPKATAAVVTIHDLCWRVAPETMRGVTRALDAALMPAALARADRVIAVSCSTRDALARFYPQHAGKIVVVHEAASTMPAPKSRAELASLGIRGRYVLFVGTPEPRKNLRRLMAGFARLHTDVELVVAGGGGWGDDVAQHAAERVRFLGPVGDEWLPSLYRHAEFLALPSLYEGFGLPLLEALSHGTPVLHGDNSSMPEVAGAAGLAVDALSVDAIAAGMQRLLGEPGLRERLAALAAAQAAKFSWQRAARETRAVFDEAVAARRARR